MREDSPEPEQGPREPVFLKTFLKHSKFWFRTPPAVAQRLERLVAEILVSPFSGIGKPEPLRHHLEGFWSRRLTSSDRVIYKVTATTVEFHGLVTTIHLASHERRPALSFLVTGLLAWTRLLSPPRELRPKRFQGDPQEPRHASHSARSTGGSRS